LFIRHLPVREKVKRAAPVREESLFNQYGIRSGQWFDRKPVSQAAEYDATVGPHAATTRLTYTCPINKIARVEMLELRATRVTVAAPVGFVNVNFSITLGGQAAISFMGLVQYGNAIGDQERDTLGVIMMLFPGEIITGASADGSTGGTVDYHIGYKITEFELKEKEVTYL